MDGESIWPRRWFENTVFSPFQHGRWSITEWRWFCQSICARCDKLCFTVLVDGELQKSNPSNSPSHLLSFHWHFGQPIIHSFAIRTNRGWIFDKIMHTPRANVKINHLDLAIDHRRCAALVRTLHCNQNKTTKMKNIARKKRKGSSYWHDNDSLAMDRSGSPTKKTIVFVPNM